MWNEILKHVLPKLSEILTFSSTLDKNQVLLIEFSRILYNSCCTLCRLGYHTSSTPMLSLESILDQIENKNIGNINNNQDLPSLTNKNDQSQDIISFESSKIQYQFDYPTPFIKSNSTDETDMEKEFIQWIELSAHDFIKFEMRYN